MGYAEPEAVYRFDEYALDLRRGVLLTSEGREISIRPKAFALLRLLVENAGQVIGHDTIMDAVWPGVTVNDEGIAQCVRDIRRALGHNARLLIRTVPKRGYMLSSTTTRVQQCGALKCRPADHRPIVAVLKFMQLPTADPDDGWSQGIDQEVIVDLSLSRSVRLLPLDVYSPGKHDYSDLANIAETAGAEYMLCGSVRRATKCVRVVACLTELCSMTCIWAERFDRVFEGLLSTEAELGCRIAAAVEFAIIHAKQRTTLRTAVESLGPQGLYQRALWHLGRSTLADNNAAAQLFGKAIRMDPSQAAPHSGLALVHFNEGAVFGSRRIAESMNLASNEAEAAIKLIPDDAEARATYAIVLVGAGQVDEAWEEALHAQRDAEYAPWAFGVQGTAQLYAGQPGQGRLMLLKSLHAAPRDPRNAVLMTQVAICHYFEGNYAATAEAARTGLARYPGYPLLYRWLAASLGQLDRPAEAQWALDRARRISPASFDFYVRRRPGWFRPDDYERHLEGLRKAGWRG